MTPFIRRFTTSFATIATCFFLAAATRLPAAIAPAENLLPTDTLAFFTVPDCAGFRAASQTSPQLMFWNDPAMKPFHDKLMAKVTEKFLAPLEKDLGLKVADFLALPQGQFTLAVTVNGSNGHDDIPPGIVALLDAKDKSSQLKTNLAALVKKWTAAGRALRTEKIHGLAFTVVPLTSNDFSGILPKKTPVSEIGKEPRPKKPGEVYFTQFESLLVAGNSPLAVDAVAAHLTGSALPAVANDPTFAADQPAQFRDAPLYYGWFNGDKLFSLLAQTPTDAGNPDAPVAKSPFTPAKIIGALGLGGLKSASFAARENRDGSTATFHITAPEAQRQGLLKILSLNAKDASAPAFVPAGVVKFSRLRLDGRQTWAELQKMIAAVSPSGLASLNAIIDVANTFGQQKNPGFDLRAALFGNLGDDLVSYQKPPVDDSFAALASPPTLFLLAVANPDQTIEAVKTVAAMSGAPGAAAEPREFLGKKIHTLSLRGGRDPVTGAAKTSSFYLCGSGGYLAMSADTAILEEYLRSAGGQVKPLAETDGLAEAAQRVGGTGGGLFGYQNARKTMRSAFKLMKNPAQADAALKPFPPAVREWADFTLLPEFEPVQKYFYFSVFAGSANADGLTLKMFAPRPPQLH